MLTKPWRNRDMVRKLRFPVPTRVWLMYTVCIYSIFLYWRVPSSCPDDIIPVLRVPYWLFRNYSILYCIPAQPPFHLYKARAARIVVNNQGKAKINQASLKLILKLMASSFSLERQIKRDQLAVFDVLSWSSGHNPYSILHYYSVHKEGPCL